MFVNLGFDELQGDVFNFLLRRRAEIWSIGNDNREAIWQINIDEPHYSSNYLHDAATHILMQKAKYDPWLLCDNPDIVANTLLLMCVRQNSMLQSQMESQLKTFRKNGGFSENMTQERLEARKAQASESDAPACPKCGKPMLKRMQRRGQNQGREFWGCSAYPNCNGTRPI